MTLAQELGNDIKAAMLAVALWYQLLTQINYYLLDADGYSLIKWLVLVSNALILNGMNKLFGQSSWNPFSQTVSEY